MKNIKRGEIYYADLKPVVGSEQGGIRPVLIVQNDRGNKYSPTTIIVSLTSSNTKSSIPTHVTIHKNELTGLKTESTALCEQITTIDKARIGKRIGNVDKETLNNVLYGCKISLNIA